MSRLAVKSSLKGKKRRKYERLNKRIEYRSIFIDNYSASLLICK